MVNVGLGWSSFLGICLAAAGLALYFVRSFRPKLARDHDIFFAAVGLLCGGILFFQGWRQDPILQFGQFLLTASTVFFAVESVRLRGVTTEQAKRSSPIVDEERPVSRRYEAVLEEFPSLGDRFNPRRIRGGKDGRSSEGRSDRDEYGRSGSREDYGRESTGRESTGRGNNSREGNGRDDWDDYGDAGRRRSSARGSDRNDNSANPRRRLRGDDGPSNTRDYLGEDEPEVRGRGRSSSASRSGNEPAATRSSRRPRSTEESGRSPRGSALEDPASEYVDYRPINRNEDETDNWGDE